MRKSIEMKNKFESLKSEAQELLNAGKIAEAKSKMEEVKTQKAAIEMQEMLEIEEDETLLNKNKATPSTKTKDGIKAFADAARQGFKNSMNEGAPENGGYTVPEDIQTQIKTFRQSKSSLLDLVTVEKVSTEKGSRTYKKRSQQTGFSVVPEGDSITEIEAPKFSRLSYEVKKYAGFLPVTNELLKDTDANIVQTVTEWIGDESRVTANKLILAKIREKGESVLTGIDDIKKALNVTLGAAFKATSKIVTNNDGLHYLDTLKDNDGKSLLSPSPADPMKPQLCAGINVVPIEVYDNEDFPTLEGKIPFVIGDLHEGIIYWDRQQTEIEASTVAQVGNMNAFSNYLTLFRAIEREDVTTKDDQAFVYGVIKVTPAG